MVFNLLAMGVGFAIVAGIASLTGSASSDLAVVFGPASGFLFAMAAVIGALRSAIIRLLTSLAGEYTTRDRDTKPAESTTDVDAPERDRDVETESG